MRGVIRALLAGWLVLLGAALAAQEGVTQGDAYDAWLATAARAEAVIEAGRASDVAMDNLRGQIARYRDQFQAAREQNSSRIKTLQSQLDAIGAAPENGAEAEEVTALRARLAERLEALKAPRIVAEEAYSHADGLIREIDRIVRDRQARRLLSRGEVPLTPALWGTAFSDLGDVLRSVANETRTSLRADTTRETLRGNLPAVLLLTALGLLLLLRGYAWSDRAGAALRRATGQGAGVWSFLVSLTKVFVPLAGLLALTRAAVLSGATGLRGGYILAEIPQWGAFLLVMRWLGDQVYARAGEDGAPLLPPGRLRELRLLVTLAALVMILTDAIAVLDEIDTIRAASRSVLGFVPVLAMSLILLRFQRVGLRLSDPKPEVAEEEDGGALRRGFAGFVPLLRRAVVLVALAAPVLAALGYAQGAEGLVYPTVLTLALIGAVIVLQRFANMLISAASRSAAADGLLSAIVGFCLMLAAVPFLALFWGARVSDLTELWARFLTGFQIGDSRISPVDFLTFAVIFGVGYAVTRLVQGGLRTNLLPKTRIDPGGQNAIVSGTGYVGIFLAALIAITSTGIDLSSLAIVAGALSVGIGFGLQTIVSNFVSGIILLVERPISKGDWIEVGGQMGYVRDISVRATRIETFDRTDVIVPNSDLISGRVTNFTRGNTIGRVVAPVGVAYGTDTKRVEAILREIAEAHPMVLASPPPNVLFRGFGADSLDFEIRAILRDVNWSLAVLSDLNHEIARRFAEEGIEIPFAQRDVWLRNPEALRGAPGEES